MATVSLSLWGGTGTLLASIAEAVARLLVLAVALLAVNWTVTVTLWPTESGPRLFHVSWPAATVSGVIEA